VGGLEYFDFGFVIKEMGKSMHQEQLTWRWFWRPHGIMVSMHGWFALFLLLQVSNSLFVYVEICFDGMEL
jgi:hypothetical protein